MSMTMLDQRPVFLHKTAQITGQRAVHMAVQDMVPARQSVNSVRLIL
jgi:hypothetical protein